MSKVRKFFTRETGSRARNIARAVLPALVILDVVHLNGLQVSACVIALEAIFSGGAEISARTTPNEGA